MEFDETFGFTDAEVREMLQYYELIDKYEEVKEWYDGYRFGNTEVYCPWDVVNYCSDHVKYPNAAPENYWMNTSGNNVMNRFIDSVQQPDMLTKAELGWLVNGETVVKKIDETVTYDDLYSTMDHLWSTLFMTGYLTQKGKEVDGRYCLAIPNQEIKNIVTERILTLFRNDVRKDGRAVL
ncbi:AAA family ATPase [Fusicatenibacter saccharivorans]|mgnify:FL=1|uniref:AAA family ATPase n=2 Tax=Lachnospiraceae TaxID=186803 RepID=UPI001FB8E2E8|nr:AAA family ATPase [Fusicatenibacter saccharivorans]